MSRTILLFLLVGLVAGGCASNRTPTSECLVGFNERALCANLSAHGLARPADAVVGHWGDRVFVLEMINGRRGDIYVMTAAQPHPRRFSPLSDAYYLDKDGNIVDWRTWSGYSILFQVPFINQQVDGTGTVFMAFNKRTNRVEVRRMDDPEALLFDVNAANKIPSGIFKTESRIFLCDVGYCRIFEKTDDGYAEVLNFEIPGAGRVVDVDPCSDLLLISQPSNTLWPWPSRILLLDPFTGQKRDLGHQIDHELFFCRHDFIGPLLAHKD